MRIVTISNELPLNALTVLRGQEYIKILAENGCSLTFRIPAGVDPESIRAVALEIVLHCWTPPDSEIQEAVLPKPDASLVLAGAIS